MASSLERAAARRLAQAFVSDLEVSAERAILTVAPRDGALTGLPGGVALTVSARTVAECEAALAVFLERLTALTLAALVLEEVSDHAD